MAKSPALLTKDLSRRAGRPRSAEPSASVSTWLPAREHDALIRLARERDASVSAVLRQIVIFRLSPR